MPTPTVTASAMQPWIDYRERLFRREREEYFPVRTWELAVGMLLFNRGYPHQTARAILDFANSFNSVECCGLVHDRDREDIERLLPDSPQGAWVHFDQWVWMPTEN